MTTTPTVRTPSAWRRYVVLGAFSVLFVWMLSHSEALLENPNTVVVVAASSLPLNESLRASGNDTITLSPSGVRDSNASTGTPSPTSIETKPPSPPPPPTNSSSLLPPINVSYVALPPGSRPERLLIVMPVGNRFYYEQFVVKNRGNSTLVIIYFGNDEEAAKRHRLNADIFVRDKGYKFGLLRKQLEQHIEKWRTEYDYLFVPDDDVTWSRGVTLEYFMTMVRANRFQICQPSRDPHGGSQSYAILTTRDGCKFRYTNFIEIQIPLFSWDFVDYVLYPTLARNPYLEIGWYLDWLWTHQFITRWTKDMAVIDAAPVAHMVAGGRDYTNTTIYQINRETVEIRAAFNVLNGPQPPHVDVCVAP